MRLRGAAVAAIACLAGAVIGPAGAPPAPPPPPPPPSLRPPTLAHAGAELDAQPALADWSLRLDTLADAGPLSPALVGQYDLSGALYRYDRVPRLADTMAGAGFSEWRIGVGRWELGTRLLPTLTDGTPCTAALAGVPAAA